MATGSTTGTNTQTASKILGAKTISDAVNIAMAAGLKIKGNQGASKDKFFLPNVFLKHISDRLYKGNPINFFTSGLPFTSEQAGSFTLSWNKYTNPAEDKTDFGTGAFKEIEVHQETFRWNKPIKLPEAVTKNDVSRGLEKNILVQRMATHLTAWTNKSYKDALDAIIAKFASNTVTVDKTSAEKLYTGIVQAATKHLKAIHKQGAEFTGYSRDNITILIQPELFDLLSTAKKIGDGTTETFLNGQYSISKVGGYKIVSADFFMDPSVDAIIATDDILLHTVSVDAANVGKVDNLSEDVGTYIEFKDLIGVTERAINNKLAVLVNKA